MRSWLATAVCLAATAAFAADTTFPAGYWERGYGIGNMASATYMVSLKVKNLARAEKEVDRRLAAAGGTMISLSGGGYYGGGNYQPPTKSKTMSYQFDEKRTEAAAKGLFDLGDLQQFSNQKPQVAPQFDEIKKKLQQLDDEMTRNADELKKMPIATYFLTTQRDRLLQSRDAYEAGLKKGVVNVTLFEPPAARN